MNDDALGLPPDDEGLSAYEAVVQEYKALSDTEAIARLAAMDDMAYDRIHKPSAEGLGVQLKTLDQRRNAAKSSSVNQGRALELPDPAPWDESVDGDALLDELVHTIRDYVVVDFYHALVVALYLIQTYIYKLWGFCARLNLTSPEPRCGKTTLQRVAGELANRAKFADNISPSAVFRWVEQHKPTLIIDEVDQWLAMDSELIQLITSGYEEGKKAVRNEWVGDSYVPTEFDLYCPCILAGIDGALKNRNW